MTPNGRSAAHTVEEAEQEIARSNENLKAALNRLNERLSGTIDSLTESLNHTIGEAEQIRENILNPVEYVRANPRTALATVLLVGVVVGMMARSGIPNRSPSSSRMPYRR